MNAAEPCPITIRDPLAAERRQRQRRPATVRREATKETGPNAIGDRRLLSVGLHHRLPVTGARHSGWHWTESRVATAADRPVPRALSVAVRAAPSWVCWGAAARGRRFGWWAESGES